MNALMAALLRGWRYTGEQIVRDGVRYVALYRDGSQYTVGVGAA